MGGYTTILAAAEGEITEKKSRFIGQIAPAASEEEALLFIEQIRKRHREAAHNVFAYILKDGGRRTSDDKEPQGTAGIPVMQVIEHEGLVDVAVVVTRYFGGTLLGTGGLARAYAAAAKAAVAAAQKKTLGLCDTFTVSYEYTFHKKIGYVLPKYKVKIIRSDFAGQVLLVGQIAGGDTERFVNEVREITAGAAVPVITGQVFAEIQ